MKSERYRIPAGIVLVLGLIHLSTALASAAGFNFTGIWKGETEIEIARRGGSKVPVSSPSRPDDVDKVGFPAGRQGAVDRSSDRIVLPPGPSTVVPRITLKIKVSKGDKVTGSFTLGSNQQKFQNGRIDSNKLTFKIGPTGKPGMDFVVVGDGDTLSVTETTPAFPILTRQYVLTRSK